MDVAAYLTRKLHPAPVAELFKQCTDPMKVVEVLERATTPEDIAELGLTRFDHDGTRSKIIHKKILEAKTWLPRFKYFLRHSEWTSKLGLDFSHFRGVTLLEWQIFDMNQFVMLPHLLDIERDKRPDWMVSGTDFDVLRACIRQPTTWDWPNDRLVRYAAIYMCLRRDRRVRVPVDHVRNYVSGMGIKWSLDIFEDEAFDDEMGFSWTCGCIAQHFLWEAADRGRSDIDIVDAEAAWTSDTRHENKASFEAWMFHEFKRLVDPIVLTEETDKTTRTTARFLALKTRLAQLTLPPIAFA